MLPSQYLEKGWIQGNFAINKSGLPVSSNSDGACAWCLSGALNASYHDGTLDRNIATIFCSMIVEKTDNDFVDWNDNKDRTQQQVIDLAKEIEQELGLSVT